MWSYLSPNQLAIPWMFNVNISRTEKNIATIKITDRVRNLPKLYPLVRNNDPFFQLMEVEKKHIDFRHKKKQ